MNKKTIYIIVAVLVVIIVVAVAAIALTYKAPATTQAVSVAKATSLQFSANATSAGVTTTLNFAGENIGTSNLTIRVDYPADNLSYILNYGTQKSWSSANSGTTWVSDNYTTDLSSWGARWTGVVTALDNWNGTGTSYTYTTTSPNSTVTVYDISVNPKLAASLFQTS
jgi:hypothetical protein